MAILDHSGRAPWIYQRVLRGGSWINNPDNARSDNRNNNIANDALCTSAYPTVLIGSTESLLKR